MKVLSEKHKELSQTISSLLGPIRTETGCERCDFYRNEEDENDLLLMEEWDCEENLQAHIKSAPFHVLKGASNLLKEPWKMMLHTDFSSAGRIDD